jgi:hypothetical protein
VSSAEEGVIRRKLAAIVENLKALEPIARMTQTQYIEDLYKRKATERLLQELLVSPSLYGHGRLNPSFPPFTKGRNPPSLEKRG